MDPLDSLSILYVIGEPKLGFQKHKKISALFEISRTFISRSEVREPPIGVHLTVFNFICRWGTGIRFSETRSISAFFKSSKIFIVRVVECVVGSDQKGSLIISSLDILTRCAVSIYNLKSSLGR